MTPHPPIPLTLKRCPFCGGEAEHNNNQFGEWIECKACFAKGSPKSYGYGDCHAAWNARVAPTPDPSLIEKALIEFEQAVGDYQRSFGSSYSVIDRYKDKRDVAHKALVDAIQLRTSPESFKPLEEIPVVRENGSVDFIKIVRDPRCEDTEELVEDLRRYARRAEDVLRHTLVIEAKHAIELVRQHLAKENA